MADKRLRLIVEAVTSQAQAAIRSFGNNLRGFGDQASRDLEKPTKAAESMGAQLGTLATAAAVFGAAIITHYARMAASTIDSMAQMAAKNLELGEGFRAVADRMGIDGNELVQHLQEAARGTIGQYQAMGLAIKALDLGIAASVDDLVKLMEIAHVRGKRYAMSTAEAFQMLIDGISSGRPMMLRHIGFLADTDAAYQAVTRSMGGTETELGLLQQKQAVFQYILKAGQPDLEAWVDTADDATDVFGRNEVATAHLRQEWGERFLPAVIAVKEAMTDVLELMDAMGHPVESQQQHLADLVKTEGTMRAATIAYAKELVIANRGRLDYNEALVEAKAAMEGYTKAEEATAWGKMYQDSARARMAVQDVGDAADESATDLEELAAAQKKASDVMGDYARSVAQENWQMARRVADAQFSMVQAAENAAFDLMKIYREAEDRRLDLLETTAIREEAQTAEHYASLRRMREDLNDALSDLEWDYQRERQELLDRAPWWVRNALKKELAERERIAKTGDKKALKEYDEALMARIRAIDPAYAKELQKLLDQHKHEEEIEKREGRQGIEREKEDWEIRLREQQRALNQELRGLERNLGYQLEEWNFHQGQREESERQSMGNIITEHENSLTKLYQDTARKLAELPPLYRQYGFDNWIQFMEGWTAGMTYWPLTIPGAAPADGGAGPKRHQAGAWNIPRNELALLHKGEMVLPAPVAQQFRETGPITIQVNLGGGYTPYQGQQIAAQVSTELGRAIRRNTR